MSRPRSGDGDVCPRYPDHGRMFMLASKRQYCPHQDHDRTGTTKMYEYNGVTPVKRGGRE